MNLHVIPDGFDTRRDDVPEVVGHKLLRHSRVRVVEVEGVDVILARVDHKALGLKGMYVNFTKFDHILTLNFGRKIISEF